MSLLSRSGSEPGQGLGGDVEVVGSHGLGVDRHAQLLAHVTGPRHVRGTRADGGHVSSGLASS